MKKLVSLLCAVMLICMTCGASAATLPLVAEGEEVTFTIWHNNISWCLEETPENMWMWDEIEAATGVSVNWVSLDEAVWGQQVSLALATNDLPDMFWHAIGTDTINQYLGQDIFLPTEDLIAEYMPNLSAILASYPDYAALSTYSDGHMYGFPYIEALDAGTLFPGPFYINKTWLEKVNMEVPTTVDEFVEVLRAFKAAGDLNGNGLDDEVPYAVNFTGAGDSFSSQNTLFYFLGCFGEAGSYGQNYPYTKIKDDQVFFVANTEAYKETLKLFNTLYTEGLLDLEGFNSGDVTHHVNSTEATAGALGIWNIYAYSNYDEYVAIPRLEGANGKGGFGLNRSELNSLSVGTITTACKNPELLCQLIDVCYDPVVSCFVNWGPAFMLTDEGQLGTQMIVDEEKTTLTQSATKEVRVGTKYDEIDGGYYRWSMTPGPGPCAIMSEYYGNLFTWSTATNWNLVDQVTNGKYEILDEYTATPPYVLAEDDSLTYSMIQPAVANIVSAYMVSSVMDGNVDETWDAYLSDLEAAGLNDMMTALNNSYAVYNTVKQNYAANATVDENGNTPVDLMVEKAKQTILNSYRPLENYMLHMN